jgi:hypothetical protein
MVDVMRLVRVRERTSVVVVAVLVASLTVLAMAAAAAAKEPTGDFAMFKQCPRFTSGVNLCVDSQTTSGEVSINGQAVPIEKTIMLQGGIDLNEETFSESFVGALNGETLSKTPQKVPGGFIKCSGIKGGGLLGILGRIVCEAVFDNKTTGVYAVTELARPASEIEINSFNLQSEKGVALSLPVKVHLESPLLGSACYIGSSADPIMLNLTSGTTSPAPPNTPISGKVGDVGAKDGFEIVELTDTTLVDNTFSAPAATGCGGTFAFLVDPLIDSSIGLPSPDGHNTVIQNNTLEEATTVGVIGSEK